MMRAARASALLPMLLVLGSLLAATSRAQASPVYNGGKVMSGPNSVYFIWYGDWGSNSATTILPNLITNLSGSSYMNILSSYDSTTGAYANFSNQITYGGSYFVSSTQNTAIYNSVGTSLNGTPGATGATSIDQIVSDVLTNGGFSGATTANSIFDVLTYSSISVSGFQSSFCGWHDSTNSGKTSLGTQYGLIGDPTIGGGCTAQSISPNGNAAADAMASVIAHETFETITDPLATAWWDSASASGGSNTGGFENGDMCNFNFGTTYNPGNGSQANVNLNGTNYLLQQQWLNQGGGQNYTGGKCVTSLALSAPTSTPEPGTIAILASALIGLGLIRRRAA